MFSTMLTGSFCMILCVFCLIFFSFHSLFPHVYQAVIQTNCFIHNFHDTSKMSAQTQNISKLMYVFFHEQNLLPNVQIKISKKQKKSCAASYFPHHFPHDPQIRTHARVSGSSFAGCNPGGKNLNPRSGKTSGPKCPRFLFLFSLCVETERDDYEDDGSGSRLLILGNSGDSLGGKVVKIFE